MQERSHLEDSAAAQFDPMPSDPTRVTCPLSRMANEFTPFSGDYLDDPYHFLARARKEEPVFYSPEIDYWVVTRYDDIREIFQDPKTWSAAITLSAVTPMSPHVLQRLRESEFRMNPVLTNLDPPDHARIRKHATNAFSTRQVAAAEPWIRELADRFIEKLITRDPGDDGKQHADLVSEFAYDLPAHVGMRFVGIPDERVPDVKAWTANRVRLTWGKCDEAAQWEEVEGLISMWRFCEQHVAAALNSDSDSFMGDLARAHRENPDALSINEMESMLFTMIVAGHETTSNVLASALLTLLSDRNLWDSLVANPGLIPQAVEEMLRYRPSVIAWRRIASREARIGSQIVPAGAKILLMLASANHDESQFPDPEFVDLNRENAKRHLSFGHGVHLCIGAGLARLELKVFLEQLTLRIPSLQLEPGQNFEYEPSLSFRGPRSVRAYW